jgi:hypothetical protein
VHGTRVWHWNDSFLQDPILGNRLALGGPKGTLGMARQVVGVDFIVLCRQKLYRLLSLYRLDKL